LILICYIFVIEGTDEQVPFHQWWSPPIPTPS